MLRLGPGRTSVPSHALVWGVAPILAIVLVLTAGGRIARGLGTTNLALSPNPIAATGSLGVGGSASVTLSAVSVSGNVILGPAANVDVHLSFSGQGMAFADTSACDTAFPQLTSTPIRCSTDSSGQIPITYFASGPTVPNGGTDTITAALDSSGTGAVTTTYTYATIDHISFSPSPIAPTGSLGVGGGVQVTVTAYDSSNNPIPGIALYMSFTTARSAEVSAADIDSECNSIGSTPTLCITGDNHYQGGNPNPNLRLDFFASGPTVPNGGTDTLTAQNAASSPTVTAADTYTYATIDHISFSPSPIAPTGSLGVGGGVQVTVTAYDSSNNPIPGIALYISFTTARSAELSAADIDAECTSISSSPTPCITGDNHYQGGNPNPNLRLDFFASGPTVPNGGTDTLTAAIDSTGTGAVTTTYTYATIDHISFSPSPIAPTGSLGVGGGVQVTVTAYDSSNTPIPGIALYISFTTARSAELSAADIDAECTSISSSPTPCITGDNHYQGGNPNPNLRLDFFASAPDLPDGGVDTITAQDAASSPTVTATDTYTYGKVTILTYTGATSGDFNDPATVSARLVEQTGSVPVSGANVTFSLNGAESCSGTTDATGKASCTVTPHEAAGPYTLSASFAGTGADLPSSTSATFTVNLEDSSLALGGPAFVAIGHPATLSATLTDPASLGESESAAPISGRTISFTLGSGAGAQSCTGITNASGVASCTIANVSQPLGSASLSASFGGDAYYQAASASGTTITFAYLASGSFVVGNLSATIGTSVTWWSPMWSSANKLSGGTAPLAFKGFAATLSSTPPVAGGTWTTTGGQSASPPASVPSYMAVIVTSKVNKSGSTIYSGTDTRIAVVRVLPGYNPATGSPGTGVLLGFLT